MCSILILAFALPPVIQDKNRMRFYEKVIKVKADVAARLIFFSDVAASSQGRGELSGAPFLGVHLDP